MALSNLTKVQTVGIGSNIEVVGVVTTGQFKSGTSNLHSTGVELTNLNVSGIATIGGNLSIGGTLTYQDVTNIDSVGIITANSNIHLEDFIFHKGDLNTKLGFPAADTFSVETGGSERIRIDSAGRVGLGTIAPSSFHANADNFVIMSDNAPVGMTLMTTNGGLDSTIAFADGTSGGTELQGAVIYQHNGDIMRFLVAQNERLRITAQNAIGIGGANYGTAGQFLKSQGSGAGAIWSTISTDLVSDTSPQLGGNLDTNSYEISLDTSHAVNFGDSNELQIKYHGGIGYIDFNGSNNLQTKIPPNKYYQVQNRTTGDNIIQAQAGGALSLYHAGSQKFVTNSSGFTCSGTLNTSAVHTSASQGAVTVASGGDMRLANGSWTGDYAGKIQHANNRIYIQGGTDTYGHVFRDHGGGDRLYITDAGHVIPADDNTYDLGISTKRWRNLYTTDLQLSNKGSENEVDGTWGNYTIQEGESDLFLINNRNGKKYKFNLTEVS